MGRKPHGTTLGAAQQTGNARQRSGWRRGCDPGGVARLRRVALLREPRGAARQSRDFQSLRAAAIDRVAPDAHADPDGPARLSAARPEIPYRPERGSDEHLDDAGPAIAQ